jgi:hypothetical protein
MVLKAKKNKACSSCSVHWVFWVFFIYPVFLYGTVESKKKLMFHFDKIEVRGDLQVFVEPSKRNREVEYFASSDIIDSVQAKVKGRTLFLEANNTFDLSRRIPLIRISAKRVFPVEVMVSIESLKEVRLHDQSNLVVKKIKGDEILLFSNSSGTLLTESIKYPVIKVRHKGAGAIILKGRETQVLEANVYNQGELKCEELFLNRAKINHYGSGNLYLAPEEWLDLNFQGPGNITLLEQPEGSVINKSEQAGKLIEAFK